MLNNIILVGRLVNEVKVEGEERKKYSITLAVNRSFKNIDGEYETDFVPVTLWGPIGENTKEYCHKGDVVGIKGRIQCQDNNVEIIAEKVTFLSSKKADENDRETD